MAETPVSRAALKQRLLNIILGTIKQYGDAHGESVFASQRSANSFAKRLAGNLLQFMEDIMVTRETEALDSLLTVQMLESQAARRGERAYQRESEEALRELNRVILEEAHNVVQDRAQ